MAKRMTQIHVLIALLAVSAAIGGAAGQLAVSAVTAIGSVTATYNWDLTKTVSPSTLEIPAGGSGVANYVVNVKRTTISQLVTVKGSFIVSNGPAGPATPSITMTFNTAPTAPAPVIACQTPGELAASTQTTCTFTATWTDTAVTAGITGQVTADPGAGGTPGSGPYSFTNDPGGRPAGSCATLKDDFVGGSLTTPSSSISYSTSLSGLQICDAAADPAGASYSYVVTFSNLDSKYCGSPITATNQATLTVDGQANTRTASATVTITLSGCTGGSVTVGDLKTTIINTYTWSLAKTGGGGSLSVDVSQELTIPYTITATQQLQGTVGYVAGKVSVQNTASSAATISGVTVSIGGQTPQTVTVSPNCQSPTLAAQATTSCSFNITNTAAPAAGAVTASVTFTGSQTAITSAAASFDYQTADTYNIGGTANIYDTVDTKGLSSAINTETGVGSLVRFEPADQRPPGTAPGMTLSDSRTFTYNMIISRVGQCANSLTVNNIATLVPQQGSTQGSLTASAQATFSVVGCNVLPLIGLRDMNQWAAVTWSWSMTKSAQPSTYQLTPGQGGQANYNIQLTRTRQSGNYWISGTLTIFNPAPYPMYISGVSLVSTAGQFGALPPNCLGGSNIGATSIPQGATLGTNYGSVPTSGLSGTFFLKAGAQIECVFNVSAGSGSAPQGNVMAMVTTYTGSVGTAGNAAYSNPPFPVNFLLPTQQWDIGGCVSLTDTATTSGFAGNWAPQLSGLPQQQQICDTRTYTYSAAITPVPTTGAICNTPVTINNNAQALPLGGGSTITATSAIQVMAIGCPVPSPGLPPSPGGFQPASLPSPPPAALQPLVVSVNPGVTATAAGSYTWNVAITNNVPDNSLVLLPGETKQVMYTVTATQVAPTTGQNMVNGQITIGNPNTASVTLNSASVALAPSTAAPAAAAQVPVTCSTALPLVLPPGGNTVCSFSATASTADPGTVTASATSTAGSSSSTQAVPYTFNAAAAAAGSAAKCAVITDRIAPSDILTPTTFSVTDNRPTGSDITVCSDTTYTFTASFGPFDAKQCNVYQVQASATATPQGAAQASTGNNILNLQVKCQQELSVDRISILVNPPIATSNTTYNWVASGIAPTYVTRLSYNDTGMLRYNLTWDNSGGTVGTISGSVTVNNPTQDAVNITSVLIQPELAGKIAGGSGSVPAVTAICQTLFLAAGSSTVCTYSTSVNGGGSGTITAEVTLSSGQVISSTQRQFTFTDAATPASSGGDSCAEIITGLMMGTALLVPGAAGPIPYKVSQVCGRGSTMIQQPVGPFTEDTCGKYSVVSTMRVRPLSSGQAAFAVITLAQLIVRDCPLTEQPKPAVTIANQLPAFNVVSYGWKLDLTSNVTKPPLVVQYDAPVVVQMTGKARRQVGMRSTRIQGSVQLMSQGTYTLNVWKVQAAGQARTGELIIVNATCPSGTMVNGMVQVPPPPAKVLCAFTVEGLPPMDGTVLPLVYVERGSKAPLAASPGVYKVAGAQRDVQGECVQIGTGRSIRKPGAAVALPGQPTREGRGLPTTPICRTASATYDLTFGPFKSTECGQYTFSSDLSADLTNSPAWVTTDLTFGLNVVGC